MANFSASMSDELLAKIEKARGKLKKSTWVKKALEEYLNGTTGKGECKCGHDQKQ